MITISVNRNVVNIYAIYRQFDVVFDRIRVELHPLYIT